MDHSQGAWRFDMWCVDNTMNKYILKTIIIYIFLEPQQMMAFCFIDNIKNYPNAYLFIYKTPFDVKLMCR